MLYPNTPATRIYEEKIIMKESLLLTQDKLIRKKQDESKPRKKWKVAKEESKDRIKE